MSSNGLPLESRRQRWPSRLGVAAVITLGLVFFWINATYAWQNTLIGGDAGFRMANAFRPVTQLNNRFWLPFVQVHIWILYLLRLPVNVFQLIPCVYAFLATIFLGLLSLRVNGRSLASVGFALLIMVCFAYQAPFNRLSVALYQEIPAAAFFFALLWAGALRPKPGRFVWAVAAVALTVRESLWIYLLAWTVAYHRLILTDPRLRRAVLCLWAIPATWLIAIPIGFWIHYGEPIRLGTGWPLMINPIGTRVLADLGASSLSVWHGIEGTGVLWLLGGLAATALVSRVWIRSAQSDESSQPGLLENLPVFSLLALSVVYGLIALFDPWEVTEGASRQAVPLIEHAYVWAIFLFHRAASSPGGWRAAARVAVVAGLVASAQPFMVTSRAPVPGEIRAAQGEVQRLVESESANGQPTVCIADDLWQGLRYWVAPTLYAQREFAPIGGPLPDGCDLGIVRGGELEDLATDLAYDRTLTVEDVPYGIYRRRGAP